MGFAAVLRVLYAPASYRDFTADVDAHITGGAVGCTPFRVVCRGSVERFGSRLAVILERDTGDFSVQADILEIDLFICFRIVVPIQPIDYQCFACAADAVLIDRNDLQRDVLFILRTDNRREIQRGVRCLHKKCGGAVWVHFVNLI